MFKLTGMIHSAASIQEIAEEMRRDSEKEIQGPPDDFGDKLKDAVKRRLNPAGRIFGSVSASGDSFGDKLRKAVKQHPKSRERAQKTAERNSSRYRKPQRRPATKSE